MRDNPFELRVRHTPMKSTFLRPLTVSALGIFLVTAPLAGTAPSPAAVGAPGGTGPASRAPSAAGAPAFPTTGLSTGAEPHIAYAFASKPEFLGGNFRLHRVDGTSAPLDYRAVGAWATVGRGAMGMVGTEAGPELWRVNRDGKVIRDRFLQHYGFAVSPDRTIVSWLDDRMRPHDVEGGGSAEFTLPRVPKGDSVGAISGAKTCKEQSPEGGGCAVFVNAAHNGGVYVSTSHGIVDQVGPMLHVSDVNASGRVTGLASRATKTDPACWGVFTPRGHRAWKTCAYRLDSFAPQGRRVLATHEQLRWNSVNRFAIMRHDGSVARAFTFDSGPNRSLSHLTWEDSHHLLGALRAHGTWSLVRIGVDGSVEYAVAPTPAVNEFSAYSLPLR